MQRLPKDSVCARVRCFTSNSWVGSSVSPQSEPFEGMILTCSIASPAPTVCCPFGDSLSTFLVNLSLDRSKRPETREPAYDTRKANLYHSDDVHAVANKWNTLKASAHTPGGKARFDVWKQARLNYVACCNNKTVRNTLLRQRSQCSRPHTQANRAYEQWEVEYWKIQREEEWQGQEKRVKRSVTLLRNLASSALSNHCFKFGRAFCGIRIGLHGN